MRFVSYCNPFYSQFVQCPNFFGIGFVLMLSSKIFSWLEMLFLSSITIIYICI